MANFSLALASSLNNSADAFPVDFDRAWQWLGYSEKRVAKQFLLKNLELDLDYLVLQPQLATFDVPRPTEQIRLTVEAFKTWGMMAGTEQGKQVRKYFLECERVAKVSAPRNYVEALKAAVVAEELRLAAEERLQLTEPIYNVVATRPNLHRALSSAKPEHLKILEATAAQLYTANELKEMFNMKSSVQAIARHLAAVWRSQYSVNIPRKTARYVVGRAWKSPSFHKPFAYPLEWAKEQLRLIF
jgi:anti-repressor protein